MPRQVRDFLLPEIPQQGLGHQISLNTINHT